MDYMKKYQCAQRPYLKEEYLGGSLISARDMHLKTLINIYRTITHRKEEDKLRLVSESIQITWNTHDILHKIEIHQKYLKDKALLDKIKKEIDDEKLNKYIDEAIKKYHLNKWKKNGTSQAMNFINFIESDENDKEVVGRL